VDVSRRRGVTPEPEREPDRERFEHTSRERERGSHAACRLASDGIVHVAVRWTGRRRTGTATNVDSTGDPHAASTCGWTDAGSRVRSGCSRRTECASNTDECSSADEHHRHDARDSARDTCAGWRGGLFE